MTQRAILRGLLAAFVTSSVAVGALAQVFSSPPDAVPSKLISGETLNLFKGAVLPATFDADAGSVINVHAESLAFTRFYTSGEINLRGRAAVGINALSPSSTINVYDGTVAGGSSSFGGVVTNVFGGKIEPNFSMWNDVLNVFDGVVSDGLVVGFSSAVNVYGGTVGTPEDFSGSKINVTAGAFPNGFLVNSRSVFTASGGSFGPMFRVNAEAEVHLIGTEFSVDGQQVGDLELGSSILFLQRDVILTARLRDGTLVKLDLDSAVGDGPSWFSHDAVLRLSLVPEPNSAMLALVAFVAAKLVLRGRRESDIPASNRRTNAG